MRFLNFTYIGFSFLLIFCSCSYKQDQILFEQKKAMADSIDQKSDTTLNSYRIKPLDILQIRNLQNIGFISGESTTSGAAQGQDFQVEQDGIVVLPAIGHVQVIGLTRMEAAKKIETMYRQVLLKDPIIELKITNLKVTMLGEIKVQGNFPLVKDKTTLVELIGEAGGLTENANEKNIKIIRGTQTNVKVIQVDLSNIRSLTDPTAILQNGDVVYIAQNKRAIRAGKLQDYSVIIQPVLILFNTALIIFTLAHR